MSSLKKILKRYVFFICALSSVMILAVISRKAGLNAFVSAVSSFKQMLTVLPPIMVLISLLDVWVPRETMMKYMGEKSGPMGVILSILMGSIAAGPMYASFPFTSVLLRKGVKFSNIITFMSAWCVTKVSTFMFEFTALGYRFSLVRLAVDLPGIIILGYVVEWMMPKCELDRVYADSQEMDRM